MQEYSGPSFPPIPVHWTVVDIIMWGGADGEGACPPVSPQAVPGNPIEDLWSSQAPAVSRSSPPLSPPALRPVAPRNTDTPLPLRRVRAPPRMTAGSPSGAFHLIFHADIPGSGLCGEGVSPSPAPAPKAIPTTVHCLGIGRFRAYSLSLCPMRSPGCFPERMVIRTRTANKMKWPTSDAGPWRPAHLTVLERPLCDRRELEKHEELRGAELEAPEVRAPHGDTQWESV